MNSIVSGTSGTRYNTSRLEGGQQTSHESWSYKMAERLRLIALCMQYKHLLPSGFRCNQSSPVLKDGLESIKTLIAAEAGTPVGTTSTSSSENDVLWYQTLPRLNIVTLRRVLSLNRRLTRLRDDDQFWKIHVGWSVPLRHEDQVIRQLPSDHPWRYYALINSPRRAMRAYQSTGLENKFNPRPLATRGVGVIDYQLTGSHEYILYSDHVLVINEEVDSGESRSSGIYQRESVHNSIAKMNVHGNNPILLTIEGDVIVGGEETPITIGQMDVGGGTIPCFPLK